jgi:hypothetical protein
MNGAKPSLILPNQFNLGNAEEENQIRDLACKFVDVGAGVSNRVFLAALAVCMGSTVRARYGWSDRQQAWESAVAIANHSRNIT